MKRLRPSPDVPSRTEKRGKSRHSAAHISAIIAVQISALLSASGGALVAPVKQPTAYANQLYGPRNPHTKPDPDMDIETLMQHLPTPHSVQEFFQKHTKYERDSFPIEFASEYRKPPEEFQKAGWTGCCNNYAEFACEWGAAHGHPMYLISLWPNGWHQKVHKSYHQLAVLCVENDKNYIMFDNDKVVEWKGTIEEYVQKEWSDFSIPPIAGKVKWVRTQNNMLAKMFYQIGFNEDDMEVAGSSNVEPRSIYVASNTR